MSADWLLELSEQYDDNHQSNNKNKGLVAYVDDLYEYPVVDLQKLKSGVVNVGSFESTLGKYRTTYEAENCVAVEIKSDEMKPHLNIGDLALIDMDASIATNDLICVQLAGEINVIRQYVQTGRDAYIKMTNKDYPTTVEMITEEMKIIGKVVEASTIRRF